MEASGVIQTSEGDQLKLENVIPTMDAMQRDLEQGMNEDALRVKYQLLSTLHPPIFNYLLEHKSYDRVTMTKLIALKIRVREGLLTPDQEEVLAGRIIFDRHAGDVVKLKHESKH
jgi:hypothetical protein